MMMIKCR